MKPSVLAILEENDCEIPTAPPPDNAQNATNPININHNFSKFNTKPLYAVSGISPEAETPQDKYIHLRQYFLNKDRSSRRSVVVNKRLEEIKNTLKNGSLEEINELYKHRHNCRQRAHEIRKDGQQICKVDSCINSALPGSQFCMNHILLDPDQKLFVKCPTCKRPIPANCDCCLESQSFQ